MKILSLSRFLRQALICLVMTALLLSPRSTSPVLADQWMEWLEQAACTSMDAYCDLGDYLPDELLWLLADPPKPNFQWNPVAPPPLKFNADDTVISAVNVPTNFWLTPGSLDEKFVTRVFGIVNWFVRWSPLVPACAWCFGDDNVGISIWYAPAVRPDLVLSRFPPVQWYEYSSYDQSERTDWGDPAFEVSAVTIWKIDIVTVVWIPPAPPVINEWSWPFVPICRQKPTPVKQVESVLIRYPWQSLGLYP